MGGDGRSDVGNAFQMKDGGEKRGGSPQVD